MASKSCATRVVMMTNSWGHNVSTGEVEDDFSTFELYFGYQTSTLIAIFHYNLLLLTRIVSHSHRMINHGLTDTCKAHAHAPFWVVTHLLPDTGSGVGYILTASTLSHTSGDTSECFRNTCGVPSSTFRQAMPTWRHYASRVVGPSLLF